jgi:hypothetical protein
MRIAVYNLPVPQIKFVIKVLFMTPNYVIITITNFTPFQCVSLIYNSEDKKTSHSDSKNLLKNMHNFLV